MGRRSRKNDNNCSLAALKDRTRQTAYANVYPLAEVYVFNALTNCASWLRYRPRERHGMAKKKGRRQNSRTSDEQVKDSNELLSLIRQQMAKLRSGPEETRPKDLNIPEPEG